MKRKIPLVWQVSLFLHWRWCNILCSFMVFQWFFFHTYSYQFYTLFMKAALHSQIGNNNEKEKVVFPHFFPLSFFFRCVECFAFNPFLEFNLKSNLSLYAVVSRYRRAKSFEQFAITTSVSAQRCVRQRNFFFLFLPSLSIGERSKCQLC